MPRVSRRKLNQSSWDQFQNDFWKAVAMLKTESEVKRFFYDLLTPTETKMLSKRLEAAKLLVRGEKYDVISKELGLGNSTIANVHNWVNAGGGGLKEIAEKLVKADKKVDMDKTDK